MTTTDGLLRLSLIQTALVWEDPEANRAHFDALLAPSIPDSSATTQDPGTDLVILPEMFTTGFSMSSQQFAEPMTGETIPWMKSKALEGNYAICGSVMMEENGKYYNRFILAESDTGLCSYDKKHLFRMSTENENYQAGDQKVCFTINGFRICPQICYDLRFPVWSRNTDNYDVLIYVANWPEARRHHWISLLKARAIENQCYVVGVNRVGADKNVSYAGDSMVFDFNGNTLLDLGDEARIGEITLNLADLVEYRHMFPAWKDADAFELI